MNSKDLSSNCAVIRLNKLKEICEELGGPTTSRLSFMMKEDPSIYSSEDVAFLEEFLSEKDEKRSIMILKVLCRFGNPVSKYLSRFKIISSQLSMEMMKIAADQNDSETILELASEDKNNMNNAVLLLKRIGKKGNLASFLFSKNNDLVDLIRDI